jgi:hypothetical protein
VGQWGGDREGKTPPKTLAFVHPPPQATQDQNNETKLDTDILMRVNDTYGNTLLIQVDTSPAPSPSSSARENPS